MTLHPHHGVAASATLLLAAAAATTVGIRLLQRILTTSHNRPPHTPATPQPPRNPTGSQVRTRVNEPTNQPTDQPTDQSTDNDTSEPTAARHRSPLTFRAVLLPPSATGPGAGKDPTSR